MGSSSRSTPRSAKLYGAWAATGRAQPCASAMATACETTHAGLSEKPLAGSVRVVVGGVDEVAAGFREQVEDPAALLFRCAPAPVLAESHRPQSELRYPEPAPAQ